ncbi:MAG: metal-binding protein [Cyanobacteria bacterium P01_F01_bin.53]
MPSGHTHDRITYWCFPIITGLTAWVTRSPSLTVIIALSFLVGGLMLGPDLDIHSVQYNRWGPIRWIWLPYQIALPHRSKYSHGPLIGTLLRVIYLALWIALFVLLITLALNAIWDAQLTWQSVSATFHNLLKHHLIEWFAILIGLEIGAMSHSISDVFGSYATRKKTSRPKSRKKSRKKNRR